MNKKCEDCGYELNSIDDECDNIDCVKCVVNVMKEQDVRGLTEVELMCMAESMAKTGKFVDDGIHVSNLVREIKEYIDGYEESVFH